MTSPTQRLNEIAGRVKKATPGDWYIGEHGHSRFGCLYTHEIAEVHICCIDKTDRDAELISHSKSDLTWLLEEVRRRGEALKNIMSIMEKESDEYALMVTYQLAKSALEGERR